MPRMEWLCAARMVRHMQLYHAHRVVRAQVLCPLPVRRRCSANDSGPSAVTLGTSATPMPETQVATSAMPALPGRQ